MVVMTLLVWATGLVNGKPRFSDPQGTKTSEPIDIKLNMGYYALDITPHSKFGANISMHEVIIPCDYFVHQLLFYLITLLYRSHRLTIFVVNTSKHVSTSSAFFARCKLMFLHFPYFLKKICIAGIGKTVIANNSVPVEGSALIFVGGIGFSIMADRMMWPPSLSPDQKWPRPPNRHRITHQVGTNWVIYKCKYRKTTQRTCFNAACIVLQCMELNYIFFHIFPQNTQYCDATRSFSLYNRIAVLAGHGIHLYF